MPKRRILLRGVEGGGQLLDGGHQGFRDVLPAVSTEAPALIRTADQFLPPPLRGRVGVGGLHHRSASRTASTKARNLS